MLWKQQHFIAVGEYFCTLLSSHDVCHSPHWRFQSLRAAEPRNELERCNFSPSLIWGEGKTRWGGKWIRWNVLSNLPTAAQSHVSYSSGLLIQAPSSLQLSVFCLSLQQALAASLLRNQGIVQEGTTSPGRPGHRAWVSACLHSCPPPAQELCHWSERSFGLGVRMTFDITDSVIGW